MRRLFGLEVRPLREIVRRLKRRPDARVLEIGVGSFAVLSACAARLLNTRVVAVDVREPIVESAREHLRRNGLDVDVRLSDIFENLPEGRFDLIWWNLPYYSDPERYLPRLFDGATTFLAPRGDMLLGYNTMALPSERVDEILARTPALVVRDRIRYGWNRHEIVSIGARASTER